MPYKTPIATEISAIVAAMRTMVGADRDPIVRPTRRSEIRRLRCGRPHCYGGGNGQEPPTRDDVNKTSVRTGFFTRLKVWSGLYRSSIRTPLAWRCQHGTWVAQGATGVYRVEPTGLIADWFSVMCYDHYGTPWRRETAHGTSAAKAIANSLENDIAGREP